MTILRVVALLLALVVGDATAAAAQQRAATPGRKQLISAAREIMVASRYCTLITNGPDGQPQARIVDAFSPDSTLVVWIATRPQTRKLTEIRKDPRVTLMYFNAMALEYVTVQGTAVISEAQADKAKHWKPDWKGFYKDENRGSDYILIKVTPRRLEIVSGLRGINSDTLTWRPVSVTLP